MKLLLALTSIALAFLASSCSSTDENAGPPPISGVYKIAPAAP